MIVKIDGEIRNLVAGGSIQRPKNGSKISRDPMTGQLMPEETEPMTIKWALVTAVLNPPKPDPQNPMPALLIAQDGFKRFKLAERIDAANGEIDLKSDELDLIRKAVGEAYSDSVSIIGQLYERLEV